MQIRNNIIWGGRECQIDIGKQWVGRLPPYLLPQEVDNGLKFVRRINSIVILLHYWSIPDGLKPDQHFFSIHLLMCIERVNGSP